MKKIFAALVTGIVGIALFAADEATSFISIRRMEFYPRTVDKCQSGEIAYNFDDGEGHQGTLVFRQLGVNAARIDLIMGDQIDTTGFDGKVFWNCNEAGCNVLTAEEAAEFCYDFRFVAIPLREDRMFRELKNVGSEPVDGDLCYVYETAPVDSPSILTKLYVSKMSGLLRKVVTVEDGVEEIIIFDDYRSIDGVRVAETILKSNDVGTFKLRLRNAKWNVRFPADTFTMPKQTTKVVLGDANVARPRVSPDSAKAQQLRARITDLEAKVQIAEAKIAKMEEMHSSNRVAEVQLSTAPVTANYYGYWRRHGLRRVVRRNARRAMRDRRRIVKDLIREDNKIAAEYEKTLKELAKLRSDLSMAQEDLKLLENAK